MAWASDERRQLLGRIAEIGQELRPPRSKDLDAPARRALYAERERLLVEYTEHLPLVEASRCPICESVFTLPIDNAGLDGPWWASRPPVPLPEPRACEHYRVFLGALDLHGRTPSEVQTGVLAGPGVPFVVPRLLELPTMQAVVSELTIGAGDTGYLIVYFSDEPPAEAELHQPWRHQSYVLHDDAGNPVAAHLTNDPWDFELRPWIERGALRWIAPGDAQLTLRDAPESPYMGLPGVRKAQVIQSGAVSLKEPPDGSEIGIYERA